VLLCVLVGGSAPQDLTKLRVACKCACLIVGLLAQCCVAAPLKALRQVPSVA
jgi:hypothetical protein